MNKILNFWLRFLFVRLYLDDSSGGGGGGSGSLMGGGGGGGQGGGGADWRAALPEDIRGDPAFSTVKAKDANEALGAIAKMYHGSQKLLGADKILKPNDKWTPEQWKSFYKEIGVPESHDKYALPDVKLAEGLSIPPEKLDKFKKLFHENGLTPKQVQAVMKTYMEDLNADFTGNQERSRSQLNAAITELKQELGDKYDAKLDIARSVLKKFGSETLLEKLESTGLANDPEIVRMFAKLGEGMLEDGAGGAGDGLILQTATQALQEINKLKMDKEFQGALTNRNAPGHKEAVEKWYQLHQQAAARKD